MLRVIEEIVVLFKDTDLITWWFVLCDCCYPSHTVLGEDLSAQRKLNHGIKGHSQ